LMSCRSLAAARSVGIPAPFVAGRRSAPRGALLLLLAAAIVCCRRTHCVSCSAGAADSSKRSGQLFGAIDIGSAAAALSYCRPTSRRVSVFC
jgi:hypothetical protein